MDRTRCSKLAKNRGGRGEKMKTGKRLRWNNRWPRRIADSIRIKIVERRCKSVSGVCIGSNGPLFWKSRDLSGLEPDKRRCHGDPGRGCGYVYVRDKNRESGPRVQLLTAFHRALCALGVLVVDPPQVFRFGDYNRGGTKWLGSWISASL